MQKQDEHEHDEHEHDVQESDADDDPFREGVRQAISDLIASQRAERYRAEGDDTPDDAPPPAELVTLARRFHRQLRVLLNESMEGTGISYAQFEVLEIVHNDRNHHAGSIAGELGLTRQSANELVRKLETAGFVERLSPDNGVRGVLITAAGEAQFERCTQAISPFRAFFGRMTPDERQGLKDALHAARAALRPPAPW